ncbi:LamG domain-containing protein [Billgrantia azerbaijanica]|nr:LamG domain-containing protein [Halomonas azerbaijanica]
MPLNIGTISDQEGGLSVRNKLNAAIAEANNVTDKLDASKVGQANGAASLGSDGKVPSAQLPASSGGVEEAPTDGATYGRRDGAWTALSAGSGGPFTVVQRDGSTAGQVHTFSLPSPQYGFGLDAYALKQGSPATGQAIEYETFDAGNEVNYSVTLGTVWRGKLAPYTGELFTTAADTEWFTAAPKADGETFRFTSETLYNVHDVLGDGSSVATYQFDGDVSDLGGANNATAGPTVTYVTGEIGQAVVTDGTSDGRVLDLAGWSAPNGALSMWVSTTQAITYGLFSFHAVAASNGDSFEVFQGSGGTGSTTKYTFPPGAYPTDGTFFHLVISLNNNVPTVYINGAEVTGFTTSSNSHGAVFSNGMLGGGVGSYYYAAKVDQLRMFSRPVTSEEVSTLYTEGSTVAKPVLLESSSGEYYSASGGTLTLVSAPASTSDFDANGTLDSGIIASSELSSMLPVSLVTGEAATVITEYTPTDQIAFESPRSAASWSALNSATLIAAEAGAGRVRVAVSRDGSTWYAWDGAAWASLGSLTADATGAGAVLTGGMDAATLNGLSWTEWGALFADSEDGTPDALAFAYAFDVPDASTDMASVSDLTLNVDLKAGWVKQSESEVVITWFNDQVTFQTVNAGNYKLAYQTP